MKSTLERLERVDKIWRRCRMVFFLGLISVPLITGINVASGQGAPLEQIGIGLLMLAYSSLVLGLCWLVFRLVRFVIEVGDESR
jgi:hypothetical protein